MHLTVPSVLEEMVALYGGSMGPVKRRHASEGPRPIWWFRASGADAERMLRHLRPFLRIKAAQADLAFEFRAALVPLASLSGPAREAQIALRWNYKRRMQELNRSWLPRG
jgi:hypothetical protein